VSAATAISVSLRDAKEGGGKCLGFRVVGFFGSRFRGFKVKCWNHKQPERRVHLGGSGARRLLCVRCQRARVAVAEPRRWERRRAREIWRLAQGVCR
jgi:hypothetical protein